MREYPGPLIEVGRKLSEVVRVCGEMRESDERPSGQTCQKVYFLKPASQVSQMSQRDRCRLRQEPKYNEQQAQRLRVYGREAYQNVYILTPAQQISKSTHLESTPVGEGAS